MIPVKLAVRNFMCYHDNVEPLYFDSFHVACLSGNNGHGKSALLDAITWALWGKTRAKSDDDLIHMGEGEMEVEFEFLVCDNQYRVIRKRTKGSLKRQGQSILELQIATPDGYTAITGNVLRETEKKIIDLLRMDYETFINSALLLQGRADEFSMKRPGERKEVLANILNLSIYDDLEKLAKTRAKEQEIRHQELSSVIARIEQQLEHKTTYETDLIAAQAAMSEIIMELEKQEASLNDLRRSREAMKYKEEQSRDIERQINQSSQQLRFLESTIQENNSRASRYEKILAEYDENSEKIQKRLADLVTTDNDLNEKRKLIEENSNRIHYLNSANNRLKEDMNELKKKLDMLEQEKAECPLCGTELGVDGRERILANYKTEGREKGDTYRANQTEMQQKETELKVLRQEVSKLEDTLTSERAQCERLIANLEKDKTEAEASLPRDRESIAQAQVALEDLHKSAIANTEKRKEILADIKDLPQLEQEFSQAEKAYRDLRDKERVYQDKVANLQANLRRCNELEAEIKDNSKAISIALKEKGIYDELAIAFGKRGVQALIIESILPEIEEEANRLLGRMTDNRMHLKIESQRDTKKGDTIETLEIRISDELGTRNYEMFSGGETFRVNFALRIAMSKLLAKRAGAPLPTIIIDEGFGTQDNTGREKLVEAINSIQDDFEKIIVITHIEELKDAFPVRIEVVKTEDGSIFSMN